MSSSSFKPSYLARLIFPLLPQQSRHHICSVVWFGKGGEAEGGRRRVVKEGGELSVNVMRLPAWGEPPSRLSWLPGEWAAGFIPACPASCSQGWWIAFKQRKILSHWEFAGGAPHLVFRAMRRGTQQTVGARVTSRLLLAGCHFKAPCWWFCTFLAHYLQILTWPTMKLEVSCLSAATGWG